MVENPGLFFWIDVNSYMFIFLALMLYPPLRTNGFVGLTPADMQAYVIRGFTGLNAFCEANEASSDETNAAITALLRPGPDG